ncbi:MAG TPA: hypothetical protein VIY86_07295, partial [Pirellulaceae bacterium]
STLSRATRRLVGKSAVAKIGKQLRDRLQGGGVSKGSVLQFLDENNDGAIQEIEAPERLKVAFSRLDKDSSGALEESELDPVVEFLNPERKQ